MEENVNPENTGENQEIRDEKGRFIPGVSGNPAGKPRGAKKSLKTYDKDRFANMSDEDKEEFLKQISPEMRYRMAEGNPAIDNNHTGVVKIIVSNESLENAADPLSIDDSEGQASV